MNCTLNVANLLVATYTHHASLLFSVHIEGTAGPPQVGDFSLPRSEVTFHLGANDGNTITVFADVFDDLIIEGAESFTLSITVVDPPAGVTVDPNGNTATINILDDDGKYL